MMMKLLRLSMIILEKQTNLLEPPSGGFFMFIEEYLLNFNF